MAEVASVLRAGHTLLGVLWPDAVWLRRLPCARFGMKPRAISSDTTDFLFRVAALRWERSAQTDVTRLLRHPFGHARAELALAHPTLPNRAPFFVLSGYIARRLGRWEESLRQLHRVVELDPRNSNAAALCTDVLVQLRRFDEAARVWAEQARKWGENPRLTAVQLASIHFAKTGETQEWHAALAALPEHLNPSAEITPQRVLAALIQRDYAASAHAGAASPLRVFSGCGLQFLIAVRVV